MPNMGEIHPATDFSYVEGMMGHDDRKLTFHECLVHLSLSPW